MKAREEMLTCLMNGNGDIEKKMQEMIKRFSQQGGMSGLDFDDFEGPNVGESDWITTEKQKILKIKVKQIKDRPLDIKIEKGTVKIKGEVESVSGSGNNKSVKKVNFEQTISIPKDVDQTSPEFENLDGEVLIKFNRLQSSKVKKSVPAKIIQKNERIPIVPSSVDVTI